MVFPIRNAHYDVIQFFNLLIKQLQSSFEENWQKENLWWNKIPINTLICFLIINNVNYICGGNQNNI